jgi:ATP-dependent Clp protease ATP-binding subunit ClpA
MFERYSEKARRVIFFARYEASAYGSKTIESEHLLLGLLREDQPMLASFVSSAKAAQEIRAEVERLTIRGPKVSTSVDLPLTEECKFALRYAAEESDRLKHHTIGAEDLLLGLLRVENCLAARILRERGADVAQIREALAKSKALPHSDVPPPGGRYSYLHLDVFTDTAFQGNQLAVFVRPRGLTSELMQRVALDAITEVLVGGRAVVVGEGVVRPG